MVALNAGAASKYVDSSLAGNGGTHDGAAWSTAWTNMDSITGLSAGDTVYISGGPAGSNHLYAVNSLTIAFPGIFIPAKGTAASRITYQIGQDSLHNNRATFVGSNVWYFFGYQGGVSNVTISGDAGDGGRHFAISNYPAIGVGQNYINVRIAYFDFGGIAGGIDFGGFYGIEFDHNYVYISSTNVDHFCSANFTGTTNWGGGGSIHDNLIYTPTSANGLGSDCFQIGGAGWDLYNNTCIAYLTNYIGGQHTDGWQSGGGINLRLYGNTFDGYANYANFGELTGPGYTNLWIYNSTFSRSSGSIVVGTSTAATDPNYFVGVIIANNTIDSTQALSQPLVLGNSTMLTTFFQNCIVANNVLIGTTNAAFPGNSTSQTTPIAGLSTTDASNQFASYVGTSASDFNLQIGSYLRSTGTNLSAYFTTDKAGNARPTSAAWDIGAYQYVNPNNVPRISGGIRGLRGF